MITQLVFTVDTANGIIARITVEILKAGYKPVKQIIKKNGNKSIIYFDIKSNATLTKSDYIQFKKAIPAIQKIEQISNIKTAQSSQDVINSISNMKKQQEENKIDALEQEVLDSIANMEKQQKKGLF